MRNPERPDTLNGLFGLVQLHVRVDSGRWCVETHHLVGLTSLKLSCGAAPGSCGNAARRLPQLTICRRAASASGVTP
jgi:hypothetical protein